MTGIDGGVELEGAQLRNREVRVCTMSARSREGDYSGEDHEKKRIECALLILNIANRLPTTLVTVTTATVYMQRFYERISPSVAKPVMVAITALYTATKAENDVRGLRRIIEAAYGLFHTQVPRQDSYTYQRLVMNVKKLEAAMLVVIGFEDVEVKQPLLILSQAIEAAGRVPQSVASPAYLMCTGMTLFTPLTSRHSMEAVAAGSLYYAAAHTNYDLGKEKPNWMKLFSKDLSESEVHQIADEYRRVCKSLDKKWLDAANNSIKLAFCGLREVEGADMKRKNNAQHLGIGGGGGCSKEVVPAQGGVCGGGGDGAAQTRRMYQGGGWLRGSTCWSTQQVQHRPPLLKSPPPPPLPRQSYSGLLGSGGGVGRKGGGAQSSSVNGKTTKNNQGDAAGGLSSSAAKARNSLYSLF